MSCDFFALATPGVQGLQPYQPGKPIEELEREYGIKNIIKLASNENPLGTNPSLINLLHSSLKQLFRYPDGNGFILKQALAKQLAINTDMLTLGNGSSDLLEIIARTFVSAESSVVFSQYTFAIYPLVTQAIGAKALVVPAVQWGHDLVAMQTAIREDTRLIFVANPNNPTGTWVNKAQLIAFLEQVPSDKIVVLDEAYFEYVENPDYPNGLTLLEKYPNLIVTRTFSKVYGLAGLRVGYAISHPQIANLLNRTRQPFNVNNLALEAATLALADNQYLEKSVISNRWGMQQLVEAFQQMKLSFIPSVGNFVTVQFPSSGLIIYEKLLREGVIVRPLANYKMPNHLRVTIGTQEENARFIQALQAVLST